MSLAQKDADEPSGAVDLKELAEADALGFRSGWIAKAYDLFSQNGWIQGSRSIGEDIDEGQVAFLTGSGLEVAEQRGFRSVLRSEPSYLALEGTGAPHLLETGGPLLVEGFPASDRFVKLDDNNPDVASARIALNNLVTELTLRAPNDLFATAETRMAVVSELRTFGDLLKQPLVRAQEIANAINNNSTIKWLSISALGGAVGNYATDILNILARIISPIIGL